MSTIVNSMASLNLRFFQVFVRQLNKGKYYLSLALYCIDAISITRICLTTSNKEMILITGFVRFYTSTFFNIQQYARTGDFTSKINFLTLTFAENGKFFMRAIGRGVRW